jgi:hypothetical protein
LGHPEYKPKEQADGKQGPWKNEVTCFTKQRATRVTDHKHQEWQPAKNERFHATVKFADGTNQLVERDGLIRARGRTQLADERVLLRQPQLLTTNQMQNGCDKQQGTKQQDNVG